MTTERPDDKKTYLFDNPRNVRRVIWALAIACAATLAGDLVVHRHVDHSWESLFGFYALFGFAAYALLVLLSEGLRRLVQRREGYYDD